MKIRKMGWFLSLFPITGITLAPFGIYIEEKYLNLDWLLNHEKIHWKQQLEMLIIFFYIWYLTEWFIRLFTNFGHAYESLSFEREAHANQYDFEYLNKRKHYSWLKYIKK